MIIDAHVHIFPDKIAEKAAQGISAFYDIPVPFDGTLDTFLHLADSAGVDMAVIQSAATSADQVESINTFIAECVRQYPDRLIGFMTLHPDYPDIEGEINRALHLGLKGVKLHPDFQKFALDDPAVFPIYECLEGRLPVLVHTGDSRYAYSNPHRLAKVLDAFPRLDVIGAHFGGWSEWAEAAEVLKGRRLWVDTSSTTYALPAEQVRSLIDLFGMEFVLFGTDYPMWGPADELRRLENIPMRTEEHEAILYKNISKLLQL